jgi:hypothetical protein
MPRAIVLVVAGALSLLGATTGSSATAAPAARCDALLHIVPGWEAVFGVRSTRTAAETLRIKATRVGFKNLVVEQVGCPKWQVALHGLADQKQGRALAVEAKAAGFNITLACHRELDLDGDWQAVFGYFKSRDAAERLRTKASRAGFRYLQILRNICTRQHYVELDGLKTLKQAREFKAEAARAGFKVTIKHH